MRQCELVRPKEEPGQGADDRSGLTSVWCPGGPASSSSVKHPASFETAAARLPRDEDHSFCEHQCSSCRGAIPWIAPRGTHGAWCPYASSEELRRPDHRPPHVGDRAVVVAETFLRLLEMPADHVGELLELHLLVGVEGVDVADADRAPRHVPLVVPGALVLVLD